MEVSMPDLTQMETFVLTVELGSLAAVSRKLGISAAAISKQLTRLEEDLGVQLLVRSTRRIELTDIGERYYQQAKRVLEEVKEASALISEAKIDPHGVLKVVSARHFAKAYIVPHIKEFLLKYPKIELNLELCERVPDVNQESIDVVIGMSVIPIGDVVQKRIATTSYSFCASPDYLKQFGIPEKPIDLKSHRYISHSMRRSENEWVVPYIRVNDTQTMLQFALDGLGIVMLHHYVVKEHIERGGLQEVLTGFTRKEIPMYVAYPQRRHIASKTRGFIDFFTKPLALA